MKIKNYVVTHNLIEVDSKSNCKDETIVLDFDNGTDGFHRYCTVNHYYTTDYEYPNNVVPLCKSERCK